MDKKFKGGLVYELPKNRSIADFFLASDDIVELISVDDLNADFDFFAQNGMAGPGKKNLTIYQTVENFCKLNQIPLLIRELPVIRINTDGWWRFSWNSFFCDEGIYPNDESYDRWSEISQSLDIQVTEWRRPGDAVLLCLQKNRDSALNRLHDIDYDYERYCIDLINDMQESTDRPIIVRSHPRDLQLAKNLREKFSHLEFSIGKSLENDFERSWCCVSYNSNSAVEAVLNGIPSIVLDSSSAAYDVSFHSICDIEKSVDFNVEAWLKRIAFMQWSPEEILSGKAWSFLKKVYPINAL